VQFHPESICTEHGRRLMENFRDLTRERSARPRPRARRRQTVRAPRAGLGLVVERIDRLYDTERAFVGLFGDEPRAFWLDSSRPGDERSRFSFMGGAGGPLGACVTSDVGARELTVSRNGTTTVRHEGIFDFLRRVLARMSLPADDLPFDFNGGFVGYFGYELKADCDGDLAHTSPLPDAAFLLADRLIAFDHLEHKTYLVCITPSAHEAEARGWVSRTRRRLDALPQLAPPAALGNGRTPEVHLSRSYEQYIADIRRCHELLADGETYEVCLTNRITVDVSPDPLTTYRILRSVNPAPFAAYLRFGDAAVLSSSPERFLSVGRDRVVEAKPIKGTTRRGSTGAQDRRLSEELRTSEKNRAENLMITDLLRNDLGVVCEVGSVHVPRLMAIESFETVHQLVSTVCGRLREDRSAPDLIQACFPGGSMTGAPKKRTMQIIDALETEARGVYSGAIGYLGLGGAADLSIVIRTIVMDGVTTSIGAGGAIVMQSDPDDEFDEMLLKAQAPLRAVALSAGTERVEHAVAHA
jgi:para-aminobenzoate synthetase